MDPRPRILVLDDEPDILETIGLLLQVHLPDAEVILKKSLAEALEALALKPDVVVADHRMKGGSGIDLLRPARDQGAATILITAYPDMDVAIDAINEGHVTRFFSKPPDPEEFARTVAEALSGQIRKRLRREAFDRLLGKA